MPADTPVAASRFAITIDGYEVGSFLELHASTVPNAPARRTLAHELTHVVQQRASAGRMKWPPITLKRGVIEQSAMRRIQTSGVIAGLALQSVDAAGKRGPRISLSKARVTRCDQMLIKGRNQVSIQELEIAMND